MNKTATFLLLCTTLFAQQKGTFTDTRDGKIYKTVKIGEQVWMAENLNYETSGSKCYDNKPANCKKYGRLYNWNTAMKVCSNGWHLPSNAEWEVLMETTGGYKTAGKFLKAVSGWKDYEGKSGNGEDKFGFYALPGGDCNQNDYFNHIGNFGYWWSSSESNSNDAYFRSMGDIDDRVYCIISDKGDLFSVRCLQD
ncbi:MAG: fibrobacter succinogenes major paralogous domain-containing protein [Fibromonadaceae bacterium]|jgi:uncharacterized protein (TIGR02145 family)|nr:fibrobacter succinogenes major paralogous domain-containing protein [Fibromonadaceae bacterium]